jgi:hypothetical protein
MPLRIVLAMMATLCFFSGRASKMKEVMAQGAINVIRGWVQSSQGVGH